MNDDAGAKLLAAFEALAAEVRGLRSEMREQRDSREILRERAERKAASQKKWRVNAKKRVSRDSRVVSPEILAPQVVKQDQEQREDLKQLPASVDSREISPLLQPKATGAVWRAYATAYRDRYRVEPVRNAKVNAQIGQLVKRLPADAAPAVAAFFLGHNHAKYVGNRHPVGLLLQDCEGLHTQWKSGQRATATAARQEDATQANMDGWAEHMSEEGRRALVSK